MDANGLRASVIEGAPPPGLSRPVEAMSRAAEGNWGKTHAIGDARLAEGGG